MSFFTGVNLRLGAETAQRAELQRLGAVFQGPGTSFKAIIERQGQNQNLVVGGRELARVYLSSIEPVTRTRQCCTSQHPQDVQEYGAIEDFVASDKS